MAATYIIQYAFGDHEKLLNLTEDWHRHLSDVHGYTYASYRHPPEGHPYLEKSKCIRRCLSDFHSSSDPVRFVWLDSDVVWTGESLDAAFAGPGLSMVKHWHQDEAMDHFNAGVMYYSGSKEEAMSFLDEWESEPTDGHVWADQYALYKMNKRGMPVNEIDYKWNSMTLFPVYRSSEPVVAAWHNCGFTEEGSRAERALAEMQRFVNSPRMPIAYQLMGWRTRSQLGDMIRGRVSYGVEVGVYRADHLQELAKKNPDAFFYGVDPYTSGYDPNDCLDNEPLLMAAKAVAHKRASRLDNVKIVESRDDVPTGQDFIYIDANHREEAVRDDLAYWHRKLEPGGTIAGHDYGIEKYGVTQAVNEFAASNGFCVYTTTEDEWPSWAICTQIAK